MVEEDEDEDEDEKTDLPFLLAVKSRRGSRCMLLT